MKKVFLFLSSALICAAMAACGGNAENTDSIIDSTPIENVEEQAPVNAEATAEDADARAKAIEEAAQAICNCGDITNCMNTVIDQTFEQYAQDEDFKAAVKAQAESCIANKVKAKAVETGKEAAKDASKKVVKDMSKKIVK